MKKFTKHLDDLLLKFIIVLALIFSFIILVDSNTKANALPSGIPDGYRTIALTDVGKEFGVDLYSKVYFDAEVYNTMPNFGSSVLELEYFIITEEFLTTDVPGSYYELDFSTYGEVLAITEDLIALEFIYVKDIDYKFSGNGTPTSLVRRTLQVGDDLTNIKLYLSNNMVFTRDEVINNVTSKFINFSSGLHIVLWQGTTHTAVQLKVYSPDTSIQYFVSPSGTFNVNEYSYNYGYVTEIKDFNNTSTIINPSKAKIIYESITADLPRVFNNLKAGDSYFDTLNEQHYIYSGSEWILSPRSDVKFVGNGTPDSLIRRTLQVGDDLSSKPIYFSNDVPQLHNSIMNGSSFVGYSLITTSSYNIRVYDDSTYLYNEIQLRMINNTVISVLYHKTNSFPNNPYTLPNDFGIVTTIKTSGTPITNEYNALKLFNGITADLPRQFNNVKFGDVYYDSLNVDYYRYNGSSWILITEDTNNITIYFSSNGGSQMASQTVVNGSKISVPNTPTKQGYTFGGWYTDESLTNLYDFNLPVNFEFFLFAKWNIDSYTITFNSNGGTPVDSQTVLYGSLINEPEEPTRDGYTFMGWYYDETYNLQWNFEIAQVTLDRTLVARWLPIGYQIAIYHDYPLHTVTNLGFNQKVVRPVDPIKPGYIFQGWFTELEYTNLYDFDSIVTTDINLYAKYVPVPPLNSPTNLTFSRDEKLLSWNATDNTSKYEVYYFITVQGFGTEYKKLGESNLPFFNVNLDFTTFGSWSDIRFKVKSIAADTTVNCDSDLSSASTYYKDVSAPIISGFSTYNYGISDFLSYIEIIDSLEITDNKTIYDQLIITSEGSYKTATTVTYGTYDLIITVTDADGNTSVKYITINIVDDVGPVITGPKVILKSTQVTFTITNILDRFTCEDNNDNSCEVYLALALDDSYTGNGTVPGSYLVRLTAKDSSNNVSNYSVTVIVASDIPAVLVFDDTEINVNKSIVLDTLDFVNLLKKTGYINSNVSFEINWSVDNYTNFENIPGTYTMTYAIDYLDGNSDNNTFTIKVLEDTGTFIPRDKTPLDHLGEFFVWIGNGIWSILSWIWNFLVGIVKWVFPFLVYIN